MNNQLTSQPPKSAERHAPVSPAHAAPTAKNTLTDDSTESAAEEILHELFRSQGMDLRESARTRGLARDFCALCEKGAE